MNNITSFDADLLPSTSEYCAAHLENFSGFSSSRQNVLTRCFRHEDRTPSLSIHIDGRFHCFSCGVTGGDVLDMHQRIYGLNFLDAVNELMSGKYKSVRSSNSFAQDTTDDLELNKRRQRSQDLWDNARAVQPGDPVDKYLSSRGLAMKDYPACLRLAADHGYYSENKELVGRFPTMLAAITDTDNKLLSLHQTYLTSYGRKADVPKVRKLRYGLPTEGGLIKLSPGTEYGVIAIGEGIETCLSFNSLYGIPVWSAISANGIAAADVPAGVRKVVAVVDADPAGRRAASALVERLTNLGISVLISEPPIPADWHGKSYDWNNHLILTRKISK